MNHFTRNSKSAEIYAKASKIPNANAVSVTNSETPPHPLPPEKQTNSLEDRQKDMLDKNSIVTGTGDYNYSIISLLVQSF